MLKTNTEPDRCTTELPLPTLAQRPLYCTEVDVYMDPTVPLDNFEISLLENMLQTISPGPWTDETDEHDSLFVFFGPEPRGYSAAYFGNLDNMVTEDICNAKFIAYCRRFMPRLLHEVLLSRCILHKKTE